MHNDFKHQLDRLQVLLEDWANWQKGYSGARGYSDHSVGLDADRRVSGNTWDDMCEEVDTWVCRMVDYAVDDLADKHPAQAAAIHKRYGISAVFRFPRDNYKEMLDQAYATLMQTLPKKGVVI